MALSSLSDDQVKFLIHALLEGRSDGASEARICEWVSWCERQLLGASLVEMVLDGELTVDWPDGQAEPTFSAKEEDDD